MSEQRDHAHHYEVEYLASSLEQKVPGPRPDQTHFANPHEMSDESWPDADTMDAVDGNDWIERLNEAVAYFEENLEHKPELKKAADAAFASSFHFQRVFHAFAGMTAGRYVRYRRLSLAAKALIEGQNVGDVALRFGYLSPEAFSRAFRRRYGVLPSQIRAGEIGIKPFERLVFVRPILEKPPMNYKIITQSSFHLTGPMLRTNMEENENQKSIPNFWIDLMKNGEFEKLCGMSRAQAFPERTSFGVSAPDPDNEEGFLYYVAVETDSGSANEYPGLTVGASDWAVFEAVGEPSEAIPPIFKFVFSEFFKDSEFAPRNDFPELEVYPDEPMGPDYVTQIWFPVQRKA